MEKYVRRFKEEELYRRVEVTKPFKCQSEKGESGTTAKGDSIMLIEWTSNNVVTFMRSGFGNVIWETSAQAIQGNIKEVR